MDYVLAQWGVEGGTQYRIWTQDNAWMPEGKFQHLHTLQISKPEIPWRSAGVNDYRECLEALAVSLWEGTFSPAIRCKSLDRAVDKKLLESK